MIQLIPTGNILVLLFKVCHLPAEIAQVDIRLLITHRTDNDILDEIGIQARVEKDVLYASGDILVTVGFQKPEAGKLLPHGLLVAIEDVAILLIAVDDFTHIGTTKSLAYYLPFCRHLSMFIYKPFFLVGSIYKPVTCPARRTEHKDTERPVLVLNLIDHI